MTDIVGVLRDNLKPHPTRLLRNADLAEAANEIERLRAMLVMTDLDCIEYAVQVVLLKCRQDNPSHMSVPASGATVMDWFAAAIKEAKQVRNGMSVPSGVREP